MATAPVAAMTRNSSFTVKGERRDTDRKVRRRHRAAAQPPGARRLRLRFKWGDAFQK